MVDNTNDSFLLKDYEDKVINDDNLANFQKEEFWEILLYLRVIDKKKKVR